MTLYDFTGGEVLTAGQLDTMYSAGWSVMLKNHIRQLIDRTGVYSADESDLWGDAFIDNTGRNDSVYGEGINPQNVSKGNNNDVVTSYTIDYTINEDNTFISQVGIGGSGQTVTIDIAISGTGSVANKTGQTLNDVSFTESDYSSLFSDGDTVTVTVTKTAGAQLYVDQSGSSMSGKYADRDSGENQGPNGGPTYEAVFSKSGTDATFDTDKYKTVSSATEFVYMEVPTGTFSATISSAVGSAIVEDWETGATIRFKLTNATEDSGWINQNEVTEFTAFTSEPTTLIVEMNPNAGDISINGFALKAE